MRAASVSRALFVAVAAAGRFSPQWSPTSPSLLLHFLVGGRRRTLFTLPFSPPPTSPAAAAAAVDDEEKPLLDSPSFASPVMEAQFEGFRLQLEDSCEVRDRIRAVVADVENASRLMTAALLLVHQHGPSPEILQKAKVQVETIKGLFGRLADVLKDCSGQYYRYHADWRSETQIVVSLMAFMHWLETETLLMHSEAEMALGLDPVEFGLDIEDYLTGLCYLSNEFPRYVVNRVTAGDYECPRKVLNFLSELHASFRMLNLQNDFLRKKFDGMKYDLRRVEEVYYDVKIRGLASGDSVPEEAAQS